jgi:DNA-binding transcriptional LysR family regulator
MRQRHTRPQFPTSQRAPQWFERIDFVSLSQAFLIADYASISRVARALGVNQAAISRRIKSLEDGLGVSLFERQSNGVRLTVAGRRFVDRTRAAFVEIESAVRNAAAAGRGAEGVIRIGIFPGPMPALLTELVKDFREAHPNVGLDFVAGSMRERIAKVMGRSLDIAIIAGANLAPDCDAERLWSARICVVLPDNHMLAICEAVDWMYLREERFIFDSDWGSEYFRDVDDWVDHSVVWLPENDNPALRRLLSLARVKAGQQRSAQSSRSDSDSA